jgi:hypothetical protein
LRVESTTHREKNSFLSFWTHRESFEWNPVPVVPRYGRALQPQKVEAKLSKDIGKSCLEKGFPYCDTSGELDTLL